MIGFDILGVAIGAPGDSSRPVSASLIIGSTASQWLRVTLLRRAHPECADYWDGNWVDSSVDVSVGAFAGKYIACLRTDEFKTFRIGQQNLSRWGPKMGEACLIARGG